MSKKEFKLYLFAGKTALSTSNIKSLKGKIPSPVNIAQRLAILKGSGVKDFEPYVLTLDLEETKQFCKEISSKVKQIPGNHAYLSMNWSLRGTEKNPAILKIQLTNEK